MDRHPSVTLDITTAAEEAITILNHQQHHTPCFLIDQLHLSIPVRDGAQLHATLWIPKRASPLASTSQPCRVGALVEYVPYRRIDGTPSRDAVMHPRFAAAGFASIRVDSRGNGDSDGGLLIDEYTLQDQTDAYDVIEWIAKQRWSSGSVGMFGISYGANMALLVATLQPPSLKAIVAVCATVDRYNDDVHYLYGCVQVNMLQWAAVMLGYNAAPPDPLHRPSDWFTLWMDRLKGHKNWAYTWMAHQRQDEYWTKNSVSKMYDKLNVPTLVIQGWADGYTDAAFDVLRDAKENHRNVHRYAIIGPWAHLYPHGGDAKPGPGIPFLNELLKWWNTWLRCDADCLDRGDYASSVYLTQPAQLQGTIPSTIQYDHHGAKSVTKEMGEDGRRGGSFPVYPPSLRVFVLDGTAKNFLDPTEERPDRSGKWIGCDWPPEEGVRRTLDLFQVVTASDDLPNSSHCTSLPNACPESYTRLSATTSENSSLDPLQCRWTGHVGLSMDAWGGYGRLNETALEQESDVAGAAVYEAAALNTNACVLGHPVVSVCVESDQPVAHIAVRLVASFPTQPDDDQHEDTNTRTSDIHCSSVQKKFVLLSWGAHNLCDRMDYENGCASNTRKELGVGETLLIQVRLRPVAVHLPKGTIIALYVTPGLFPLLWAPPAPVRLRIAPQSTTVPILALPLLSKGDYSGPVAQQHFVRDAAALNSPTMVSVVEEGEFSIERRRCDPAVEYFQRDNEGLKAFVGTSGVVRGGTMSISYRMSDAADPNSTTHSMHHTIVYQFPHTDARVELPLLLKACGVPRGIENNVLAPTVTTRDVVRILGIEVETETHLSSNPTHFTIWTKICGKISLEDSEENGVGSTTMVVHQLEEKKQFPRDFV